MYLLKIYCSLLEDSRWALNHKRIFHGILPLVDIPDKCKPGVVVVPKKTPHKSDKDDDSSGDDQNNACNGEDRNAVCSGDCLNNLWYDPHQNNDCSDPH